VINCTSGEKQISDLQQINALFLTSVKKDRKLGDDFCYPGRCCWCGVANDWRHYFQSRSLCRRVLGCDAAGCIWRQCAHHALMINCIRDSTQRADLTPATQNLISIGT